MNRLTTLWFNTGTICNIECKNCYIESSPTNDRLAFLSTDEVAGYLNEIEREGYATEEIGITGGEPFINPDIISIMEDCLNRGYELLVLTNAMKPMMNKREPLRALNEQFGDQLTVRVSTDHFDPELHEEERGEGTWKPMLKGLKWLSEQGFTLHVAGRTRWHDDEEYMRDGFHDLFEEHNVPVNAYNPEELILFPEMEADRDVPEITENCWSKVNTNPEDIMCSSSRMVVKHKGDDRPSVQACTLIAYDREFTLGNTLKESFREVPLNHRNCAQFCVLGGGDCSS